MKLGLYGGGFKPFHTGHFAKLLLALDEADKVVSFFGIQRQQFSKKTGKPLKTRFRRFGNKPDARLFDQDMQEEVVSIYEDALENAFPGSLDIVPSADETPIRKIFNVLSNFAYQNMTEEERRGLSEDIPQVSMGQNLKDFNMNSISEIVVVVGEEELDKIYIAGIDRQAEKSEIGKKIKELVESGKIRFETGAADQQRLVDLLGRYREGASDDHVLVRGSDVRSLAADRDIDSLLRYIPSVVPEDQRNQIIKILTGEDESARVQQSESFFMPIITDSTVLKAAARFASSKNVEKRIVEQKKKGEGHILGLTEDMSLTFDSLKSLISDVLSGRVDHIEEKMDGQNLTFTVLDNGEIRLFGKGVTSTTLDRGGKGKSDLEDSYGKNKNLLDAFSSAYNVVEKYLATKDAEAIRSLFQNGRVVIEGQIMTPINPNTIPYTENHVRFIRPFTPDDLEVNMDAYRDVFEDTDVEIQDQDGRAWSFGPVPKLEQVETDASEMHAKIEELERDIENLIGEINPTPRTIGDYASYAMEKYVDEVAPQIKLGNLSADQKERALERLATGNKSAIGKRELGEFWPEIQKFEKLRTAHVAAAIVDLEKIVQKLGTYFFDTLEFALATNDAVVADLAAEVEKIKSARESDAIAIKNVESGSISDLVDTTWATKLDSSLSRVEQLDLFKKAVEGVVLRMPGPEGSQIVRKLTGMFTPIHRLVSLFKYPDRYSGEILSIEDSDDEDLTGEEIKALSEALKLVVKNLGSRNLTLEGGNAFRPRDKRGRPTGPPVTTDEKISRSVATEIIATVVKNVLEPLGLSHLPVGSTATNKEEIGDIDLTVGEPSVEKLVADLQGLSYLSSEIIEGIPRVAKLPGGRAATIMIEHQGKYYQVDLFTSDEIEDTAWELSGGGEGEIKGVYRNLVLSLLAKVKGERESTPEKTVKYTISFPGGWREKINGKEKSEGRIIDPDEYLPLLGIKTSKDNIRNFESLIDYMNLNKSDIFEEALNRFEEYISNRINAKSESVRESAAKAIEYLSKLKNTSSQDINELYDIIEHLIQEASPTLLSESPDDSSSVEFFKSPWSEDLRMFHSGGWNLWDQRASATASDGRDPEGAEKAVAAMENLRHLAEQGYKLVEADGGDILVQGGNINVRLDNQEAVEYIIGIRTTQDKVSLPAAKIKHVAGTKPYDLEDAETSTPLEVKKMASSTSSNLSKLGSASGRIFDKNVKIIKPLRRAGQIASSFIDEGGIINDDGTATVRKLVDAPESFSIEEVADVVEMIDYLFNRVRYGSSPDEHAGISIKVGGGQLAAGMVRRIKSGDLLKVKDKGDLVDACASVLNKTLGDYSPASKKKPDADTESEVEVSATSGDIEYSGSVSLEYFYDELIFRLFDSENDDFFIDEDLIKSYTKSIEMISAIYAPLKVINQNQGEDAFDEFISSLHYGGFYGVTGNHYYCVPCDPEYLTVYSTTQGFRAVLKIKNSPPSLPQIPSVSRKRVAPETEVDLEIELVKPDDKGEAREDPEETQPEPPDVSDDNSKEEDEK